VGYLNTYCPIDSIGQKNDQASKKSVPGEFLVQASVYPAYTHSAWQLADDEVFIIDAPEIPECQTWNFQLDNWWMESLDYRHHTIHVNFLDSLGRYEFYTGSSQHRASEDSTIH
tara:strand:- start:214 stop:555 length:342 start_codon:yes stop_codon:yes gene_type:complete